jgi:dolichyl-diphosphooligosaccharide--protein glycosyltransferase
MPAWFGVIASILVGCIAYEATVENNSMTVLDVFFDALKGHYTEVSRELTMRPSGYYKLSSLIGLRSPAVECAVFAMGFMAIIPSHLMRSVGGMYDNESVAMSAMCLTFYFWMRSLRSGEKYNYQFGILTGVAYFYMVATWGGYVFVLNLIGAHAAFLVLIGRFSNKVYFAYTLFYVVGTSLAIQIPVVGWAPLKSLEQLGPCAVFLGYQFLQYCEVMRKKNKWTCSEAWKFRIKLGSAAAIIVVSAVAVLAPRGYFGPISSRVRGLFVPHTKTGNPLVDSVGEHFATPTEAYWEYLHIACFLAPMGFVMTLFRFRDSASFLYLFAIAAYFFSLKMTRLLVLTAPVASALSGIAIGRLLTWSLSLFMIKDDAIATIDDKKPKQHKKTPASKKSAKAPQESYKGFAASHNGFSTYSKYLESRNMRGLVSIVTFGSIYYIGKTFHAWCWRLSVARGGLSAPLIMSKNRARDKDGNEFDVTVDDFRQACWWLRDKTPKDARILAWWDFGYQINSLANRTTTADGNTWNHEHIALIGKALTGSEKEGFEIARHLADYIFLRMGGSAGDDFGKSPHYARIANSVYRDHCPGDPTCLQYSDVSSFSFSLLTTFQYHLIHDSLA